LESKLIQFEVTGIEVKIKVEVIRLLQVKMVHPQELHHKRKHNLLSLHKTLPPCYKECAACFVFSKRKNFLVRLELV
jgi:hypothetical protein